MQRDGKHTTDLSERARGWLVFGLCTMLGSFLILFSSLFFWPGYGSTIHISPLDRFLLGHYPLWFLVCGFFHLGVAVELFPTWLFSHLLFKISYPLDKEGEKPDFRTKVKALLVTGIGFLPGIVYFILGHTEEALHPRLDPVGHLLLWLARVKGYTGLYYHEYLALAVSEWFLAGIVFTFSLGFILLYYKYKQKASESSGNPKV